MFSVFVIVCDEIVLTSFFKFYTTVLSALFNFKLLISVSIWSNEVSVYELAEISADNALPLASYKLFKFFISVSVYALACVSTVVKLEDNNVILSSITGLKLSNTSLSNFKLRFPLISFIFALIV
jgi:hypothetical protein